MTKNKEMNKQNYIINIFFFNKLCVLFNDIVHNWSVLMPWGIMWHINNDDAKILSSIDNKYSKA